MRLWTIYWRHSVVTELEFVWLEWKGKEMHVNVMLFWYLHCRSHLCVQQDRPSCASVFIQWSCSVRGCSRRYDVPVVWLPCTGHHSSRTTFALLLPDGHQPDGLLRPSWRLHPPRWSSKWHGWFAKVRSRFILHHTLWHFLPWPLCSEVYQLSLLLHYVPRWRTPRDYTARSHLQLLWHRQFQGIRL